LSILHIGHMNKFYIQDSTLGKYVVFDSVPDLVNHLKAMIPRAFNITKEQYIQNLLDLGHGYDDPQGIMLTRAMADQFNIGVIKNNSYIRTDVHDTITFQKE